MPPSSGSGDGSEAPEAETAPARSASRTSQENRRAETQDRRPGTENRRPETGGRKQETGGRRSAGGTSDGGRMASNAAVTVRRSKGRLAHITFFMTCEAGRRRAIIGWATGPGFGMGGGPRLTWRNYVTLGIQSNYK